MHYFCILILMICFVSPVLGEEIDSPQLIGADSVRYQEYKQEGLDKFNKKDYANAIHYWEKAYELNRWDPWLQEMLYFSYLYVNRDFEARRFYYIMPEATRDYYQLKVPNVFTSAYVEGGFLTSKEANYTLPDMTYYKERVRTGLGRSFSAKISHDAGDRVSASHSLSYSYSAAEQLVDSMSVGIFRGDISTQQFSYTVDAPIYLGKGWKLTPAIYLSYVSSRYFQVTFDTTVNNIQPPFDFDFDDNNGFNPWQRPNNRGEEGLRQSNGWGGNGFYNPFFPFNNGGAPFNNGEYGGYGYYMPMWWNWGGMLPPWLNWGSSYAYKFEAVESTLFNYAIDLDLSKIYKHSEYSVALTYLQSGKQDIWKTSAQWVCYPKGNIDLYTMMRASYLMREAMDNDLLAEGLLGFKAQDWLWVELGGLWGNMNGHSDRNLNVVYALQPQTSFRLVGNFIFPVSNTMSLSLLYRFVKSESSVYYAPTAETLEMKRYAVYGNNLFLGIKWAL